MLRAGLLTARASEIVERRALLNTQNEITCALQDYASVKAYTERVLLTNNPDTSTPVTSSSYFAHLHYLGKKHGCRHTRDLNDQFQKKDPQLYFFCLARSPLFRIWYPFWYDTFGTITMATRPML